MAQYGKKNSQTAQRKSFILKQKIKKKKEFF